MRISRSATRSPGILRSHTIVISVANAVPLATIAERVGVPVVKAIPTLAHVVGRGVSLLVAGPGAEPKHVDAVRNVFARFQRADADRSTRRPRSIQRGRIGDRSVRRALRRLRLSQCGPKRGFGPSTLDAMMAETAGAVAALAKSRLWLG